MQDNNTNTFDQAAATWEDKPQRVALAHSVANSITKTISLNNQMAALEYGCGTGLVSRQIAPFVKQITAIDSSLEMLTILKQKARQEELTNINTAKMDFVKQITLQQNPSQKFNYTQVFTVRPNRLPRSGGTV